MATQIRKPEGGFMTHKRAAALLKGIDKNPALQTGLLAEEIEEAFLSFAASPDGEAYFSSDNPHIEENVKAITDWLRANIAPADCVLESAWSLALVNCEGIVADPTWMPRQERFKALEASLSVAQLKSLVGGDTSSLSEKQLKWLEKLGDVDAFVEMYRR